VVKSVANAVSDKILRQLELLETQAANPRDLRARQFQEVIEALRSALQEVEAVEEELAIQNEDLIAANEALAVERHRYRDLFDLAPDGFLLTDQHGTIQEANRAACGILGTALEALKRKPLTVFFGVEERSRLRARLAELRPGRRLDDLELPLYRYRAGPPRSALITIIREEAKPEAPPRLFWVLRDISERRAAQEALRESEERLRHSQRLESIGRLAGGIAHSFNNLLAAIGFHAGLLLDQLSPEACARRHAEEILAAGDRAAALARQLLAFGRKQVLQPQVLRINEILAGMETMMRRLIGEHIQLGVQLCPQDEPVCVDLGQLEQVILNLVVNARDAMPYGGRLTLSTEIKILEQAERWGDEDLSPGTYMALTVKDEGIGMDPATLARIFEPFFTTKDREKGTGLGLATVHGIVHQSGGGLKVKSAPGQGATFTILLPRTEEVEAAAPRPAALLPSPAASPATGGSEVVLVVEDEANIREPITEILGARGYTVLAASDASEALAMSEGHPEPIHLLITDMMMPGMTGNQLAEYLARNRPELRVLYMSGYPESTIAQDGILQPGQSFLQKPFPPGLLLNTVRSVLDQVALAK
jgi:PAS domain S-box-containing protein